MSKAYDRMEWDFREETLRTMGFHTNFIDFVMECISLVSYSILLKRCPYGTIQPTRGLRHDAPLSSYLFILYT